MGVSMFWVWTWASMGDLGFSLRSIRFDVRCAAWLFNSQPRLALQPIRLTFNFWIAWGAFQCLFCKTFRPNSGLRIVRGLSETSRRKHSMTTVRWENPSPQFGPAYAFVAPEIRLLHVLLTLFLANSQFENRGSWRGVSFLGTAVGHRGQLPYFQRFTIRLDGTPSRLVSAL